MTRTLELAIAKAAELPEAVQDRLGRELLERIATLTRLRADLEVGLRELDAGLGETLDVGDVLRRARGRHAERAVNGGVVAGAMMS